MPSYLAAWLFWLALPVGTLPLLMLLELTGPTRGQVLAPALRRLLMAAPALFVLVAPVLFRLGDLYPWTGDARVGGALAQAWWQPTFFTVRSIAYLLVWLALTMVFIRPPEPNHVRFRRALGVGGLGLHAVVGTLGRHRLGDVDPARLVLGRVRLGPPRRSGGDRHGRRGADRRRAAAAGGHLLAGAPAPRPGLDLGLSPVHAVPRRLVRRPAARGRLVPAARRRLRPGGDLAGRPLRVRGTVPRPDLARDAPAARPSSAVSPASSSSSTLWRCCGW